MVHALRLYQILDIPLEKMSGENGNDGKINFLEMCRIGQMIRESKLLTVYYKKHQIYLHKSLRNQFTYSVEIFLHPKNTKELLIRENTVDTPKAIYCSKKLVQKISRSVQVKGNMQFLCIWDETANGWRGILLPEMTESYLWENLRRYGCYLEDTVIRKDAIIHAMYRKCRNMAEREEVNLFYDLAYQLAVCSNLFEGKQIWYLILMYTHTLLNGLKRVSRQCLKVELPISLNQPVKGNDRFTFLDFWSGGDIPHMELEIKEFLNKLTGFEKVLLSWLEQERDLENNISFGYRLKAAITEGIRSLRAKANDYYGRDYIRSLLVMKK